MLKKNEKSKVKSKTINLLSEMKKEEKKVECKPLINQIVEVKKKEGMVVKAIMKPKKKINTEDGEWEVIDKREKDLIQKPEDSDDTQ